MQSYSFGPHATIVLQKLKDHIVQKAAGWAVAGFVAASASLLTWGFPDAWNSLAIWATTTVTPRALFALLSLSLLFSVVLLAFLIPKLGEEPRTLIGGIYWDKKGNPYCPSCKTPVAKYGTYNYGDKGYYCAVCKAVFVLADASGKPIDPIEAQRRL